MEHQYDCKGNHRIVDEDTIGEPAIYECPAFMEKDGKSYMAVTPYYEGSLPSVEGVFELTRTGRDSPKVQAYNLFSPGESCPHLDGPLLAGNCLTSCPQKKQEEG